MKKIFKKILLSLAIVFSVASTISFTTTNFVYAEGSEDGGGGGSYSGSGSTNTSGNCRYFLGMPSWDCGLPDIKDEQTLKDGAVIILANVLTSLSVIASYLVLGFVIYGGYLYIFSSGDVGKIQNSKKTITRAFIGLAITNLSNVILTAIRYATLNGAAFSSCRDSTTGMITQCVEPSTVVTNALQWFIGTAGVVALIFIVVGGVGYITSAGDSAKLQKSKNTILYALIGLIIVAISEILVSFISGIIANAAP